ncbi:hypothetical protein IJT17_05945, partial [bacterium]|nr:hypothetical protein [bacterium]
GWQVYPRYIFDLQQYLHGIHSGAEDLVTWLARNINPIYGLAILLGWWLLIWGIGLAWQSQSQRAIIALTPPLALAAMLITANALHIQVLQKRHLLPLCPALLAFICLQIVAINSSTIRRLLTALLLGSCALTAILFPFNTRLWNQHWQGAIDFIEQRCDAHTMILVYHSGAFYSFAHAYAPGQIIYNPQTGKISVDKNYSGPLIVPLTKNTANPNFLRDIKGYRLFIVLNQYQYENAKDHLFDWICQNFDLGQAYHEDSYTDWAVVDVAELTPKLNE